MPHAPTGMHGPLRALDASHCLHCGALAYREPQPLRSNENVDNWGWHLTVQTIFMLLFSDQSYSQTQFF